MERSIRYVINLYNPNDPLDSAWMVPSPWCLDPHVALGPYSKIIVLLR
jgi:hypothetical protein